MDFTPLREVMDTFPGLGIPQSDIVVTLDDKILFRYSVGIEAPPEPDAIYHLYSVSKVITCVAAAQLLEKCMVEVITLNVPLMAEVHQGSNWAEAK